MSTFKASLALAASLIGTAVPAWAHHSAAMFDFTQNHWSEGVVKDIRVINPHMTLTLVVTDAKGTHDIFFEGHSVNNFYRAGWRPHMINVGDKIKVRFNPRKDGLDGGFVNGFVTAQGKEIAFRVPGAESGGGSGTGGTGGAGGAAEKRSGGGQ
jgi:Family of unknown function (DUF6152)